MGVGSNIGQSLVNAGAGKAMQAGSSVGGAIGGKIGGAAGAAVGASIGSSLVGFGLNALMGLFGRTDPDITFSFYVEIDGIRCVKFAEASGLEWKMEPVQFYEGGNYRYKVSLPGPTSFSPLVLKRGFFSAGSEFYTWMRSVTDPSNKKLKDATVSLVILNDSGSEVARYNLFGAFISKYKAPSFNGKEDAIAIEEIEIIYDEFEFVPGGALMGALQAGLSALGGAVGIKI